jgi:O-antigen/teichoic acid export membrane protein
MLAQAGGGHLSLSLRDKVRSGLLWSTFQNWGLRCSAMLLFMFVARVLSAEQLGLFAFATVMLSFFGMLCEQGLSEAVVQREHVTPEQMNAVFWLNMSASLVIVLVVWLVAPQIAAAMNIPALTSILQVASLALPLSAASFGQMAMRKRAFSYRWIATTTLASTSVGIVVVLGLLFTGFGVWSLVAQTLVGAAVVTGLMWLRPIWRLSRRADFRAARPLMAYGSSRLGTNMLDFANSRYIEIFLAATLGPAALAIYTVGLKLPQALMQMFCSTILDVAHGGFSRLADDRPNLVSAYYKSVSITATLAVPVFCMVAAVAPMLSVVLFGAKWAGSAEVMRWMAVLGAVQVLQFYNGTVYNAIGRPLIGLQFMIVKVILTFAALAWVRDGDMSDLLHAYILSQLATTPMSFYLVRRMIGVSLIELLRGLWPMLCGCLLLAAAAIATQTVLKVHALPAIVLLVASVAAGVLVYLCFLYLVARHVLRDTLNLVRPRRGAVTAPAPLAVEAMAK